MRDLHYDDIATPRHFVWVATWREGGHWWARFGVDAKIGEPEKLGPATDD